MAEYGEVGIWLWRDQSNLTLDEARGGVQFHLRRQFREDYGYVVASAEVMAVLADLLKPLGPVLDAGCGSGYLSEELTRLGVSTFAVDCRDYHVQRTAPAGYPIKAVVKLDAIGDAPTFVTDNFGAVLLAWPPYGRTFAFRVAQAMLPGQLLVYEGEAAGGCTADDAFFAHMADAARWEQVENISARLNRHHVALDSLHDHWTVWRRRP